jgi:hypothetical protein
MKTTKKELEKKIKGLEAILKKNGIVEKKDTKMDEIRKLESEAADAIGKIIWKCQDKTGREILKNTDLLEECDKKGIEKLLGKLSLRQVGLSGFLKQFVPIVKKHWEFTSADDLNSWMNGKIKENWNN